MYFYQTLERQLTISGCVGVLFDIQQTKDVFEELDLTWLLVMRESRPVLEGTGPMGGYRLKHSCLRGCHN